MLNRKLFLFVLLFPCFCFSATQAEMQSVVSNCLVNVYDIDYRLDSYHRYINDNMYLYIDDYVSEGGMTSGTANTFKQILSNFDNNLIYLKNFTSQIRSELTSLSFSTDSNGNVSCSWTTNDILQVVEGVYYASQTLNSFYNDVFVGDDSLFAKISAIYSTEYQTTLDIQRFEHEFLTSQSYLNSIKTWTATIRDNTSSIASNSSTISNFLSNLDTTLTSISSSVATVANYMEPLYNIIYLIYGNTIITASNTASLVSIDSSLLSVLSNRFYRSSNLEFSSQTYNAKTTQNNLMEKKSYAPYYTPIQRNQATIFDLIYGGFLNNIVSLGSINNYLYYLEQAVVSNNDARIVAHLGAISNLVHRVDDYVLSDFSNEFHTLAVEIDSWYQGGVSNQNQIAISNQFYLSVITQQVNSVSDLLQTNNFLTSELLIITNDLGQISTNIAWFVDNIRSLELPVTSEFRGDHDTYYDFLTNYYLSGTANDNPSSNWFERVEVLLAALVFSGNSTTNISDTLSDSSSLSQQVETLINTIDFSQDSSNTITLSRNVQQTYISFFHSLRNIISSKSNTSTFVIGWGDKDTTTFDDLVDGNFRISISTSDGVFGSFTNIFRSVTTMVWVLFTLFCIYKMGFWLCSRIYSLYSIVRSLIFSLWGK